MQVAFFSNFLNHHQLPFCLEMVKQLGDGFKFVAFEPTPEDKLSLGYHDMNSSYDFVIRAYGKDANSDEIKNIAQDCDVLILGAAPKKYLYERANGNNLCFYYSERIYKTGIKHMFSPRFIKELHNEYKPLRHRPVYLLCAGAYVASDFAFLGNFIGKSFKWGYFPEFEELDIEQVLRDKPSDKIHILWTGRLIDWKHPELAVEMAKMLRDRRYDFELDIIGEGDQADIIEQKIDSYNLNSCVHILGSKHPEEIREYMKKAHIFLFTSDRNEGWGAVLNEAMNSGCVVICNKAIGAVPFLIRNGYNGCVYDRDDLDKMIHYAEETIKNREAREYISRNAYYTIANEWNPKYAANRFIELSKGLLSRKKICYKKGPCSRC